MCTALQQLASTMAYVHYSAGVWGGVRGVVIWLTEMEKRENNSRAVPTLRFGRMVWLKKNTNARDGLDFNLMQATQMCAGDTAPTLFIPRFICIHMTSGLPMLYMIEKQFWSAKSLLYLQILGVCKWGWTLYGGRAQERHKGGDLQEAYCSQARSISNIAAPDCSQADTDMDWII